MCINITDISENSLYSNGDNLHILLPIKILQNSSRGINSFNKTIDLCKNLPIMEAQNQVLIKNNA